MDQTEKTVLLRKIVYELSQILRKQDFLTYFKKLSLLHIAENELTL